MSGYTRSYFDAEADFVAGFAFLQTLWRRQLSSQHLPNVLATLVANEMWLTHFLCRSISIQNRVERILL